MLQTSHLRTKNAAWGAVVHAGEYWLGEIAKGDVFRITDLKGNQAVDTLFFNARNPHERYSAVDTIREQGNLYLTTGTTLLSDEGNALLDIVADTCGPPRQPRRRLCRREQHRALRAGEENHALLPRQLALGGEHAPAMAPDQARHRHNINFFMNVR